MLTAYSRALLPVRAYGRYSLHWWATAVLLPAEGYFRYLRPLFYFVRRNYELYRSAYTLPADRFF